jgi:hypothetical protein
MRKQLSKHAPINHFGVNKSMTDDDQEAAKLALKQKLAKHLNKLHSCSEKDTVKLNMLAAVGAADDGSKLGC